MTTKLTTDEILAHYVTTLQKRPRNRTQGKIQRNRLSLFKRKLIDAEGETRANKLIKHTVDAMALMILR